MVPGMFEPNLEVDEGYLDRPTVAIAGCLVCNLLGYPPTMKVGLVPLQDAAQQPTPPWTPAPQAEARGATGHNDSHSANTISLDTTLADLYRANGIEGPFLMTMHCVFAHMDLHPAWPRELVYPEDEEPVPHSHSNRHEVARLRRVVLGMKPLRRAFGVGDMDVLFFAPNVTAGGMAKALSQLAPAQRHRPVIVDLDLGATDVQAQIRRSAEGRKLLFWRPQGWMDAHRCLLDPRGMYDVNSKQFLVTAGIRTPPSQVVNLQAVSLADMSSCPFRSRPLPFVVKLFRAGCSFGTFIVKTEGQRAVMLRAMAKYKARGTTEVLLCKYIDLVQDLSVHFVVGAPGSFHDRDNPFIVGVTVQTLTDDGKWVGGHIDFSMQQELRRLVWDTVQDTTRKMPQAFMGWAGVDIVVEKDGGQWVVDLNARFTGSMPMCLMAGHFWRRRSLPLAEFSAVEYGGDEDDIYNRLERFVGTGQIIVTATAAVEEGVNMADVVWGGRDADELAEVQTWMRQTLAKAPAAI